LREGAPNEKASRKTRLVNAVWEGKSYSVGGKREIFMNPGSGGTCIPFVQPFCATLRGPSGKAKIYRIGGISEKKKKGAAREKTGFKFI